MPSPTAPPTAAPTALPTAPSSALPTWAQATRLAPGSKPPQFVVVSWDGAGETSGLFAHFREFAQRHQMGMTFFVSGIYLLPESRRADYHPPRHAVGAADIGLLSDAAIRATLTQIRGAWLEGHEIGTHFNGHFCGKGGGGDWTPAEWDSEIDQSVRFVKTWRTATGFTDLPPLPFDYDKELVLHMHIEGNVLFPRAQQLEAKHRAPAPRRGACSSSPRRESPSSAASAPPGATASPWRSSA